MDIVTGLPDNFAIPGIQWREEVSVKGGKAYIEGYISTDELDRLREVVTPQAMQGMVSQFKSGNVKLDLEHEKFQEQIYGQPRFAPSTPLGRIVDAELVQTDGQHKVWVKAELNQDYVQRDTQGNVVKTFREVWSEIKNGFLDAFSIAYKAKPVEGAITHTVVGGVKATLLNAIEILNAAITGNPICRGARISSAFMKSAVALEQQNTEVQPPMAENKQEAAPAPAAAPQAPDYEASLKSITAAHEAAIKEVKDTFSNEFAGLKSLVEKQAETIAAQDKTLADLKSAHTAQVAELKALLEKPILKSMVAPEKTEAAEKKATPLEQIH
jgi:hypothetical protein